MVDHKKLRITMPTIGSETPASEVLGMVEGDIPEASCRSHASCSLQHIPNPKTIANSDIYSKIVCVDKQLAAEQL